MQPPPPDAKLPRPATRITPVQSPASLGSMRAHLQRRAWRGMSATSILTGWGEPQRDCIIWRDTFRLREPPGQRWMAPVAPVQPAADRLDDGALDLQILAQADARVSVRSPSVVIVEPGRSALLAPVQDAASGPVSSCPLGGVHPRRNGRVRRRRARSSPLAAGRRRLHRCNWARPGRAPCRCSPRYAPPSDQSMPRGLVAPVRSRAAPG